MKKKVLLVEDDEGILDAMTMILEEEHFEVFPLADGTKVFETVSSFEPDVVLLDVLMSGVDGREVCKELKKDNTTKHIPLIMVSAHPSIKNSVEECGANAFLAKPFEVDDLIVLVSKYAGVLNQ